MKFPYKLQLTPDTSTFHVGKNSGIVMGQVSNWGEGVMFRPRTIFRPRTRFFGHYQLYSVIYSSSLMISWPEKCLILSTFEAIFKPILTDIKQKIHNPTFVCSLTILGGSIFKYNYHL